MPIPVRPGLRNLLRRAAQLRLNLRYALPLRKPRVVARIARGVTLSALGRAPLRYVDLALDFTCNQKCQHCFAKSYDHQRERGRNLLTAGDYRRIAREALALGAVSFSIQGGEPFAVYERTTEVLSCLDPRRSLLSIKSNGTLITRARARGVKRLGVDIVTISLDSGDPTEHDFFRGMRGAHAKALEGVAHCLDAGIRVILACTLSRQNANTPGVLKLIEVSRDMGVMLLFILAAPSGQWGGNRSVLLSDADGRWLREILRRHPHCRTDFDANWLRHGCGALKEIVYIDQYGNVMACPFIQISFGNVLDRPLGEILANGASHRDFQGYADRCLIAQDKVFIERYLAAVAGRSDLPIPLADLGPPGSERLSSE